MSVRTNVAGALGVLESNQAVLFRQLGDVVGRLVLLESLVEQQQALVERVGLRLGLLVGEVERLSADLDVALADLDAIGAGP